MTQATPAVLYTFVAGTTPLLINVPHAGTYIPVALRKDMTPVAQTTPDTDWHVHLLYEFALQLGAGMMVATHSRYVVDLNRDPENVALYKGADNTELCPTRSFANEHLYLRGQFPTTAQLAERRERYWQPYHAHLRAAIDEIKARHGYAILLDGHSIRSQVPRFFEGRLPSLNLGTADGASCSHVLQQSVAEILRAADGLPSVVNGRFKGGYITRHYGRPQSQVHALQLEITQDSYMDEEAPFAWQPRRARLLTAVLEKIVKAILAEKPGNL